MLLGKLCASSDERSFTCHRHVLAYRIFKSYSNNIFVRKSMNKSDWLNTRLPVCFSQYIYNMVSEPCKTQAQTALNVSKCRQRVILRGRFS